MQCRKCRYSKPEAEITVETTVTLSAEASASPKAPVRRW